MRLSFHRSPCQLVGCCQTASFLIVPDRLLLPAGLRAVEPVEWVRLELKPTGALLHSSAGDVRQRDAKSKQNCHAVLRCRQAEVPLRWHGSERAACELAEQTVDSCLLH